MAPDYIDYYERAERLATLPERPGIGKRWEEGFQTEHAQFVARAIGEYSRRNDDWNQWEFGGDGDNGEFLTYVVDMLLEAGVIIVPDKWVVKEEG